MPKIASIAALSLLALALAGCQQPNTPNVAAYQNPSVATSGICGVYSDCPVTGSYAQPYAMQGESAGSF